MYRETETEEKRVCDSIVQGGYDFDRLLKIIGLFCTISSLLQKETYVFKEPTNRSHPIRAMPPSCVCHVCVPCMCVMPEYANDMAHKYERVMAHMNASSSQSFVYDVYDASSSHATRDLNSHPQGEPRNPNARVRI